MKIKNSTSKLIGIQGDNGIASTELINLVEEAESTGGINSEESELIKNAIEFNDVEVWDILTPRVDIVGISMDASLDEILSIFKESGYSRIPVYKETIDTIIGVLTEKDFYHLATDGEHTLSAMMKPVLLIPSTTNVFQLLKDLQKKKTHMAVVVDEFGGTEGIVTMEDILEELVGEIWDEKDQMTAEISQIADHTYTVPTKNDLDDFCEKFQIIKSSETFTINGWVVENIDKVPVVGDTFQYENLTIAITKTEKRRVTEIRVTVDYEKVEEE